MTTPTNVLKARLKHGPKFSSREMRAEYSLCMIGAPPRTLRPETLAKLRSELKRLERSGNPQVQKFVSEMRLKYRGVLR